MITVRISTNHHLSGLVSYEVLTVGQDGDTLGRETFFEREKAIVRALECSPHGTTFDGMKVEFPRIEHPTAAQAVSPDIKHTAGPWGPQRMDKQTLSIVPHVGSRFRALIVGLGTGEVVGFAIGATIEECAANAHLTAAAPTMLAALRRVRVVCEDSYADALMAGDADAAAGAKESWDMVKAAIADAEGRTDG